MDLNFANDTQTLLASKDDTDHEITIPASGESNFLESDLSTSKIIFRLARIIFRLARNGPTDCRQFVSIKSILLI